MLCPFKCVCGVRSRSWGFQEEQATQLTTSLVSLPFSPSRLPPSFAPSSRFSFGVMIQFLNFLVRAGFQEPAAREMNILGTFVLQKFQAQKGAPGGLYLSFLSGR